MTDAPTSHHDESGSLDWIERIRRWIFRGYPQGVPTNEALPLLQVLKPHFSEADITKVVRAIIHDHESLIQSSERSNLGPGEENQPLLMLPEDGIEEYVRTVLHQEPDKDVVRRVLARLMEANENGDLPQHPTDSQ